MAEGANPKDPDSDARLREEVGLAINTRRELGEQYDDKLAEALVERIESLIDERVCAAIEETGTKHTIDTKAFLAVVCSTIGVSIPVFIIAAIVAGTQGFYVVMGMIVFVNLLWLWRSR